MLGGHLGRPRGLPKTGNRKNGSVNRATAGRALRGWRRQEH